MKKSIWIISVLIWLMSGIGPVAADDTAIFGEPPRAIEPNVLIIFDTSLSMEHLPPDLHTIYSDIPKDPYDPDTDYSAGSAGYIKNAVYRWSNASDAWTKFVAGTGSLDAGSCGDAIDELNANGFTFATVNDSSPYDCDPNEESYNRYDLRMGNQLNYETGGYTGDKITRLAAAKTVINNLIDKHPNVRYGLMRFGGSKKSCNYWGCSVSTDWQHGGRLVGNGNGKGEIEEYSKARATELKGLVNDLTADDYTPLAETLAEAGLYFAGKTAHFDAGYYDDGPYTSPIDIKCRPNYVIIMTDGESTADDDPILGSEITYMLGEKIGAPYHNDGGLYKEEYHDALPYVAKFLYEHDLMTGEDMDGKQNVITYTIGFKNTDPLLRKAAEAGGGRFFTASSAAALTMAFDEIFGDIETGSQIYVTPSVPVSRANGVYADNVLYLGLFKPDMSSSNWLGNLKKYKLSPNFDVLYGGDGKPATDDGGNFLETAQSFWSATADGTQVDAGGAGAALVSATDRKLYTFIDGVGADTDLTATRNAFHKDNALLTAALLAADDANHRNAIIDDIRGLKTDGTKKKWMMADVLHSAPQVVLYDTDGDGDIEDDDGSVIYLGTNGGVMHAFWDKGTSVEESWGFVPPSQVDRLKLLSQASVKHNYFLDGPPSVFTASAARYLAFGERRGGRNYYALDITKYNKPKWQYEVGEDILGGASAEQLGQSWGRPQFAKIATGSATTGEVLLLPGGYDTNQDSDAITAADSRGRAVFSVTATGGSLGTFKFYNDATSGENSDMAYSIVDVVGVDTVGNGLVNSIYAPDLGGDMFAFTDADGNGEWNKSKLFYASTGTTLSTRRKIFYAPAVINITGDPTPTDGTRDIASGEMIFFGSGDRADPKEIQVTNRFYAVKNYWWDSNGFSYPMTESNLHNATDNDIVQGTAAEKTAAAKELVEKMGWFIDLEHSGEKIVGSPVVFNGVVYFTTYTPPASSVVASTNDCDASNVAAGTARLYGLDYRDGRSVHDDWNIVPDTDAETGEDVGSGGKNDRWKDIGEYLPSPPVIIVHKGYARLYVGAGKKLAVIKPKEAPEMKMYYWRDTQP